MGNDYIGWGQETECPLHASRRSCDCVPGEMHIWFDPCEGSKEISVSSGCHNEDSLGRVLDVNLTLCGMCPGRRCAVGMELVELDEEGAEYPRGFRAFTVPAHSAAQNRDVPLPAVRFILPEDGSAGCGGRRHFVARVTNHYVEENSRQR